MGEMYLSNSSLAIINNMDSNNYRCKETLDNNTSKLGRFKKSMKEFLFIQERRFVLMFGLGLVSQFSDMDGECGVGGLKATTIALGIKFRITLPCNLLQPSLRDQKFLLSII